MTIPRRSVRSSIARTFAARQSRSGRSIVVFTMAPAPRGFGMELVYTGIRDAVNLSAAGLEPDPVGNPVRRVAQLPAREVECERELVAVPCEPVLRGGEPLRGL